MQQQTSLEGELLFDIWHGDTIQGMAKGKTPKDARQMVQKSRPDISDTCLLIPYYDRGTSEATYEALTGRKVKNIFG